jgi:phosphoesterase RecJ-like protein
MNTLLNSHWEEVVDLIMRGERFLITTHINPDGDAIGSEMALTYLLKYFGKAVRIINDSPVPYNLHFLDPNNVIETLAKKTSAHLKLPTLDGIFILDINDWERLGGLKKFIRESQARKVCLDHHLIQDKPGDINIIEEGACNTGILIFELINRLGLDLTKPMAEALYVSLLTDTGSFRFSNTNPKAHEMAAQLIKAGISIHEIYSKVYEQSSWARIRLLGEVLSSIGSCCQNKVAYLVITQEILNSYSVQTDELEGFIEFPRAIKEIEVIILFHEMGKEKTRISLRSKGKVNVQEIARIFGGGGHPYAAGISLEMPLKKAIRTLLDIVEEKVGV